MDRDLHTLPRVTDTQAVVQRSLFPGSAPKLSVIPTKLCGSTENKSERDDPFLLLKSPLRMHSEMSKYKYVRGSNESSEFQRDGAYKTGILWSPPAGKSCENLAIGHEQRKRISIPQSPSEHLGSSSVSSVANSPSTSTKTTPISEVPENPLAAIEKLSVLRLPFESERRTLPSENIFVPVTNMDFVVHPRLSGPHAVPVSSRERISQSCTPASIRSRVVVRAKVVMPSPRSPRVKRDEDLPSFMRATESSFRRREENLKVVQGRKRRNGNTVLISTPIDTNNPSR
ncbi:hypothetical protein EDC01DRAFT_634181 [Geopyxis carbonaria]|nr:hypothetical protein EDC01DRAFT_634181 [Geopyxis carbonaria]